MTEFDRFALYWAPEPGPFADLAARWLGWDPAGGRSLAHPDVGGLPRPVAELTEAPRKYGFHGTVKPPFRLAAGQTPEALHRAASDLCARLAPIRLDGLALHRLGGFVALVPQGDQGRLAEVAGRVVAELDDFRAPPDAAEIARRRPERLTDRQRDNLTRWGYPYVMEEFQFHLTLTGDLPGDEAAQVAAVLAPLFHPVLPRPFRVASLCLFGQARDGRFKMLHRYSMSG